MADRFKKVQAGQPLHVSAEVWNAFLDSVRERKGRNHDQLTEVLDQFRQGDIVKLRNNSGQDCSRFNVLAINTPIITPAANEREFKNRVSISGVRPMHPTHFSRFGILLDPVRHGKIGRAWISGVCPAFISVTDNCHLFADVKHNDSGSLESRPYGSAQILWREGGLGDQWAIVRLANVSEDFRRFRLLTSLSKCGTAQAQRIVYSEPIPGIPNWCNVDCLFQVYDSLGVVDSPMGEPAPAGTSGWAKWLPDSRKWEVVQIGDGCCQGSSSSGSSSSISWSSWSSSYGSSSSSWSSSSSGSSSGSSSDSSSGSSASSSTSESSISSSESSGSSGSSDSSSSAPESCVTIYETDVRCEDGLLNVYRRAVSICLDNGSLNRYEGPWDFWHGAGCCKCDCPPSSSSTSSSWSSSWSYSSSWSSDWSSSWLSSVEPSVEPSVSKESSYLPSGSSSWLSSVEPSVSTESSLWPSVSSAVPSSSGSVSGSSSSLWSVSASEFEPSFDFPIDFP